MTQRAENVPNSQALGAAALYLSACTFFTAAAQDSALAPAKNIATANSRLEPGAVEQDLNSLVATGNWDARLPALPESTEDLPVAVTAQPLEQAKPDLTSQNSSWINTLLSAGAVVVSTLGYLFYAVRSTPLEKRSQHLVTRLAAPLDQKEDFYPGNSTSLRIWTTNNAALALSALALAVTNNQGFVSIIVPAVMCLGSAMVLPLALKYGNKSPPNAFMKSCEVLSYSSIALFIASQFEAVSLAITTSGFNSAVVGASLGLGARTLSMIPFISDFIHEARNPDLEKGFPQLKNTCLWTAGTMLAAATVQIPLSTSAIVPLGYMAQNLFFTAVAFGSYFVWRQRHATLLSSAKDREQSSAKHY